MGQVQLDGVLVGVNDVVFYWCEQFQQFIFGIGIDICMVYFLVQDVYQCIEFVWGDFCVGMGFCYGFVFVFVVVVGDGVDLLGDVGFDWGEFDVVEVVFGVFVGGIVVDCVVDEGFDYWFVVQLLVECGIGCCWCGVGCQQDWQCESD